MSTFDLPETQAVDSWPDGKCWFCGDPAPGRSAYRAGVHRNATTTPIALGLASRAEWERIEIDVPRCPRCRVGHYAEVLLFAAGFPALVCGTALLLDTALGTFDALPLVPLTVPRIGVWFLPFIAWLALRHGWFGLGRWFPHNRRYVRRHPAVRHRLDTGWRYGRAPMSQWDKRWF